MGSEISGLQLSKLSNVAKDQLALLIAQRKLLIFHDQDFADLPIQEAVNWAAYFGRPYIQYVSGEHFSSYSGMSQEELRLVPLKTL
jgi:alpha-ketoglutarate-dependent taurine dioxygenase